VCINHNLWQRRCHAYQSCPSHPAHLSPIQPDPLHPSPAIWHNNAGKWSMTRIQESRNPRIQGSCNCRRLSILLLLDESFLQGESRSVPLVPMLHFTQLVAFPRVSAQFLAGDQLYVLSKYFVSFFFWCWCCMNCWPATTCWPIVVVRLCDAWGWGFVGWGFRGEYQWHWAPWWLSQLLQSVAGCA